MSLQKKEFILHFVPRVKSKLVLTDDEKGFLHSLDQYDDEMVCLRTLSMVYSEV